MHSYIKTLLNDIKNSSWNFKTFVCTSLAVGVFVTLTIVPPYPSYEPAPFGGFFVSFVPSSNLSALPITYGQVVVTIFLAIMAFLWFTDSRRNYRLSRGEVYTWTSLVILLILIILNGLYFWVPLAFNSSSRAQSWGIWIDSFSLATKVLFMRLILLPIDIYYRRRTKSVKGISSRNIFK